MTLSLKGFVCNPTLANNSKGVTARVGELTTWARTFSSNHQQLSKSGSALEVVVFSNKDDVGVQVQITQPHKDKLLEFVAWVYEQAPAWFGRTTRLDMIAAITAAFGQNFAMVDVFDVVQTVTMSIPSSVSFTLTLPYSETMQVRLWFSASEFEAQYDEYEARVVPPIDAIGTFLSNYATVQSALTVVNTTRDSIRIAQAAGKDPYTSMTPVEVIWVDPSNHENRLSTFWYVIGYGTRAADNDTLLSEIVAFINRSDASASIDWRVVFPDLFRVTRFVLYPNWGKGAISGRVGIPVIYSPFTDNTFVEECKNTTDEVMPAIYNLNDFESFNHPYRSVSMVAFAGVDNREGAFTLYQAYSDYIAASTMNEDFQRQAEITKVFHERVDALLRACEGFSLQTPSLVQGLRHVVKGNKNFIVTTVNNIELMMSVKE